MNEIHRGFSSKNDKIIKASIDRIELFNSRLFQEFSITIKDIREQKQKVRPNSDTVTVNLVDRSERLGKVCLIYVLIWSRVCSECKGNPVIVAWPSPAGRFVLCAIT